MNGTILHWINFACLALVFVLATAGIFSTRFQDNLLQRLGMVSMAFGAVFAAWHYVLGTAPGTPRFAILYGITLYGLGKAWRLLHEPDKPSRYRQWRLLTDAGPMQVQDPARCAACGNRVEPPTEIESRRLKLWLHNSAAGVEGLAEPMATDQPERQST